MLKFFPILSANNTAFSNSLANHTSYLFNENNLTDLITYVYEENSTAYNFSMFDWQEAKKKEKADFLTVELFTQLSSSSVDQNIIKEEFQQQQHYFFSELDKDTCDKWIFAWQFLKEKKARDVTLFGLINLALEAFIDTYQQVDFNTLYNYGISLYEDHTPFTIVPVLEKLRLYKLKYNLKWVDLNQLAQFKNHPMLLLKFILSHNNHPFPHQGFWEHPSEGIAQSFCQESIRSFDECALVWNQLQTGDMLTGVTNEGDGELIISNLRNAFKKELITSYQKQKIIEQLFSQPGNNSEGIYYDGFSLRNAQNWNFQELSHRPELSSITGFNELTAEKKQNYMQEAFKQMGESTQYRVGSLAHSLASCLIRVFFYQHNRMPPLFRNVQQLIILFKEAEEEWIEKKNYPINLRILVALHLARSNNVAIEGKDWREKLKFVLNYLAEEFQYVLDPGHIDKLKPPFNRAQAALEVLKAYGMSAEEINSKRPPYRLVISNPEKQAPDRVLTDIREVPLRSDTALDEFLKKAQFAKVPNLMKVKGHLINPYDELSKKAQEFDNQLDHDLWIEEKAKISLKLQAMALTPARLEQEKQRLMAAHRNAIADQQQWTDSIRKWVYFIPIIGSLETIYDGLKEKNLKTVLLGIAFLSLDGWTLGLGGVIKSIPLAVSRLSVREQITAYSLKTSLELFEVSAADIARSEPLINRLPFTSEESYESLAQAVRQGASDKLWRDVQGEEHLLAYLEDEKRIVAVKNQGGYYREIDLLTGKVNFKKPLIYRNKDTGRYIVSSLKGGGGEDFFVELIPEAELKGSPTVKEALQALAKANDFKNYPNFLEKFRRHFQILKEEGGFLDVEGICLRAYINSPTFRRLYNKFAISAELGGGPWRIEVKSGQECHTDLMNKVIYLDPNIEKAEARYLSTSVNNNEGEPFNLEGMIIHELVHALTKLDDLESLVQGRLISQAHRGGVVYLTDRISFETFAPMPERLAYRGFNKDRVMINKENLISRVIQENHYLDTTLNEAVPIEEYKLIAGESWISRYTIKEMEKITSLFSKSSKAAITANFEERFTEYFISKDEELFDELVSFFSAIYVESKIFRRLFDRFSLVERGERAIELIEIKPNAAAKVIAPMEGAVHLIEDDMLYISAEGPLPIERRRRFLEKMLEVLTNLKAEAVPPEIRFSQRGALVQMIDKIFRQAKMEKYYPKRLVAANFLPNEHLNAFLNNLSSLSRIADLEDRFLEKEIYNPKQTCSWLLCSSTSRVKRRENIDEIMEEIKKSNQQLGLKA